jgi:murein DD-endopeptidase MepM/ murein hydrolase activator NlpD
MTRIQIRPSRPLARLAGASALALALAGCETNNLDWDLRRPANGFSTSEAARNATTRRPQPDARGVISYPGYQVAVAQRGDTVGSIARRVGVDAAQLARYNALDPNVTLRGGEVLALPTRVAAAPALAGPVSEPGGSIGVTTLGPAPSASAAPQVAAPAREPIRHQVQRGETAFTIARLYSVSTRALAEWNGLPADMSVREGQFLLIPVTESGAPATPVPAPASGQPSETPVPPSASQPLPAAPAAPATPTPTTAPADLGSQRSAASAPRLAMPVEGRIIRAYARGRNDGIGIAAPAGTTVRAAAAGTVAAITRDTDQVPILVIRHDNNLLTVYANIDNIRVERGARVNRGDAIGVVRAGDPAFLHFEVREGFESVDPMPFLQ